MFRRLIQSQLESGNKEDAAKSCASAIQLAKKRIPSKLLDVLKIQVHVGTIVLYCMRSVSCTLKVLSLDSV